MQIGRFTIALAAFAALGACELKSDTGDETPDPQPTVSPSEEPAEAVSILRTDIEQPELPMAPLEPLAATVGFPEGGTALDAAALLELQKIIISEQLELGGTIILGGHSDAAGTDAANERASRARAQRVRDWLIENGVPEQRIAIIAFGEQNPAEPNALPDGTPNEAGRALNRRVEVLVIPPETAGTQIDAAADATAD